MTKTRTPPRRRYPGQIRLHLQPQRGGLLTRWRLTGSLVTAVPLRELRHVLGKLSLWSGCPIELVLPAGATPGRWWDSWENAIGRLPTSHVEVRFDVPAWMDDDV